MKETAFLAEILLFPVVSMTLGGLFAFYRQLGTKTISGMQHLASGILIGAVSWELVPDIDPETTIEKGASIIGLASGVCFLLLLGRFEFARLTRKCYGGTYREHDESLINEDSQASLSDLEDGKRLIKSPPVVSSPGPRDFKIPGTDILVSDYANKPEPDDDTPLQKTPVPMGLIFGVILDGTIDGLLIGLSFSVRTSAGLLTSIALAFEMCLLGISTSATLRLTTLPSWAVVILIFLFPTPIFGAGMLGANALQGLTGAYLIFVISFGIGALLFLVAEELLVKAHEDADTDRWYVTILFYCGFVFVMGLEFV